VRFKVPQPVNFKREEITMAKSISPQAPTNPTSDPLAAAGVTGSSHPFDDEPSHGHVGLNGPDTLPAVIPVEPVMQAPGEVAAPAPAVVPQYEVVRPVTISWGNQMLNLKDGDIISDESHGTGAIERMKAAGVAFKEVVPAKV
jgi:hypothetical protein